MTELARFIDASPMIDTHEHLLPEARFVTEGPDVLQHLFDSYVPHDLRSAGATEEQVKALLYSRKMSVAERFKPIEPAWQRCRHTGYGQAVRIMAARLFGIGDEFTPRAIEAAEARNAELRAPGGRLRVLRDLANLDHVQIDAFGLPAPDESGPSIFLYDLSWSSLANGQIDPTQIEKRCGEAVHDLPSLRRAIEATFARYGPLAIAVKTQHAYSRTLAWRDRDDADAAAVLERALRGDNLGTDERLCLGDWCLARGVEQAVAHGLPVKIHTGYYAGNGYMGASFGIDGIRASQLAPLLAKYPAARFVLMHMAYPFDDEIVAIAKHFPNVVVDLCWAWSIAPDAAAAFVRRMIHAVPASKLFAFGGDTGWPGSSLAYSIQARQWLTRALQAEVDERLLTEVEAIELARRMMLDNQRDVFDIDATRSANERAVASPRQPAAAASSGNQVAAR